MSRRRHSYILAVALLVVMAASVVDSLPSFSSYCHRKLIEKKATSSSSSGGGQSNSTSSRSYNGVVLEETTPRRTQSTLIVESSASSSSLQDKWTTTPSEGQAAAAASSSSWIWSLCLPLWLVYISNQWSRFSLSYMVDFSSSSSGGGFAAMNVDIQFDETQYGILASVAFTSLYAVASLLAGICSDWYNRKHLTILSTLLWSLTLLATSWSVTFAQVLTWRLLMGFACAFSTPAAYTLIQERVPEQTQVFALSLYSTAVAMAGGLSSLTLLVLPLAGWRHSLQGLAMFGVLSALLTGWLVRDDVKGGTNLNANNIAASWLEDDDKSDSELDDNNLPNRSRGSQTMPAESSDDHTSAATTALFYHVAEVLSNRRVQWLFMASFLRYCAGLLIGVWSPPFFRMAFGQDRQANYAVTQAAICVIASTVSGLVGGALADWLSSNSSSPIAEGTIGVSSCTKIAAGDSLRVKLWVPVMGSLLAASAWCLTIRSAASSSFVASMTWLTIEYLMAESWFGPTISVLQSSVAAINKGGIAQGLFTLPGAVANLSPSWLGHAYSNQLSRLVDDDGSTSQATLLGRLLVVSVGFSYLASAACFAFAAKCTGSAAPPTTATALLE